MTIKEQEEHFERMVAKIGQTMFKKGNDYADLDRLSNFKRAGEICGMSAEQQCLSLIATKVARLGVLLAGKVPSNEAIRDSVMDLATYSFLLDMILSEQEF